MTSIYCSHSQFLSHFYWYWRLNSVAFPLSLSSAIVIFYFLNLFLHFNTFILFIYFYVMLRIESSASEMQGKCFTTDPNHSPSFLICDHISLSHWAALELVILLAQPLKLLGLQLCTATLILSTLFLKKFFKHTTFSCYY